MILSEEDEMLTFQIRKVKNGLVLKAILREEDSGGEEIVYQEKYDDEVECFADFLRYLDDEYGPATSRYSEKRIYITIKPGDKYDK